MELEYLRSLLSDLSKIQLSDPREPNIFSIGARGHYENPISDLLVFFLDPNEQHNLKTLVLQALLDCLDEKIQLSASLTNAPQREVATHSGGRLDILLESEEWVMVLENKIWHQQNNPFTDYKNFITKNYKDKKRWLFVVLSPSGESPSDWYGISYPEFLKHLSSKLGLAFVETTFNKWLVLLREFLLHLESLMGNSFIPEKTADFVLSHLNDIKQIQDLKSRVIQDLQAQCVSYLEGRFGARGFEICTRMHTWSGYPALRFSFTHWLSDSDVVLFLNGDKKRFIASFRGRRP